MNDIFLTRMRGAKGRNKKTFSERNFLTRISKSLNESGYNISTFVVTILFILYLLVFFFIGFSNIGPSFFGLPEKVKIEDIYSNSTYSNAKDSLIYVGILNSKIRSAFYQKLVSDPELERYLKDADNTDVQNKILVKVDEIAYSTIDKVLNIPKQSLPPFNFNVSAILKVIQGNKEITDKKSAFYSAVLKEFINYLHNSPMDYQLLMMANLPLQRLFFKFGFGLIFLFQGLLIFFAFVCKPLEDMSKNKLEQQIPSWLQMMTNSMQAGNSISQAIDYSKERIKEPPLSDILEIVSNRYNTFKNLGEALEPLKKWEGKIPELKSVISALEIQERKGGNIIPVLFTLSSLFTKRRFFMQKVESIASEATGQLKIIFVMFFFIILMTESFLKYFKTFLSPAYMFFTKGGGFAGFINILFIHGIIFGISFGLYKWGEKIVKNSMNF